MTSEDGSTRSFRHGDGTTAVAAGTFASVAEGGRVRLRGVCGRVRRLGVDGPQLARHVLHV